MLSGLSKLADRNFVIGFFLSALLTTLVAAVAFPDIPWLSREASKFGSAKSLTDLTYFVFGVWTFAVVLSVFNHSLYRLYEGYLPPISWMTFLKKWHQRRFQALQKRILDMERAWANDLAGYPADEKRALEALNRELLTTYPTSAGLVLPTAFGNAIHAFESYPPRIYGVDSISAWIRLSTVIPNAFQLSIEDARAPVNFLLNTSFLAFGMGVLAFGYLIQNGLATLVPQFAGLTYSAEFSRLGTATLVWFATPLAHRLIVTTVASAVVWYLAYRWAIISVQPWGDLVKSAFDCYLPALAKQLGFTLPPTAAGRCKFWNAFSRQTNYAIPVLPEEWDLATCSPQELANGDNAPGGGTDAVDEDNDPDEDA